VFFSPACGPAFGRSAHVRKPRPARQPLAPALPPRPRPPAPPLSTALPPPARPPCPPRLPRSTFHRHRSWQFLQDPLFMWELKELAPVMAPIGTRYASHTSRTSCTNNIQHVVGRARYTNVASVEQHCPWGARRVNGSCKKIKCAGAES
jgi:hypothetical protein